LGYGTEKSESCTLPVVTSNALLSKVPRLSPGDELPGGKRCPDRSRSVTGRGAETGGEAAERNRIHRRTRSCGRIAVGATAPLVETGFVGRVPGESVFVYGEIPQIANHCHGA